MPGVLDYNAITKDYGRPWSHRRLRALDGFTLSLERGEIFGFLGRNGAGKTTAIHLALGFMRPSSGSGQLLGKPFGDAPSRCAAACRVKTWRRCGWLPFPVRPGAGLRRLAAAGVVAACG